jgi:hypothetical protein
MSAEDRQRLIAEIERRRNSKVIVYFCGDRPMASTAIADDVIRPMYDHLRALEAKPEKLDLYLYSLGGLMETPWKIVTMLREFCKELSVVVPYKAYSAATMIALGADRITMIDKSELGPIDPQLNVAGAPEKPQFVLPQIGVEDIASYITFLRQRAGLTDQAALAGSVAALVNNLTPPLLGRIERVYSHIRLVARKLLSLARPPIDDRRVTAIIEALTEKTYVHGHGIGRQEANEIGLNVEVLNGNIATLIWQLYLEYEGLLKLLGSHDPKFHFTDTGPDLYEETDQVFACIESLSMVHGFKGNFRLNRVRRIPPNPTININLNLQLPPNLQAGQLPAQTQQLLNQLLQQAAQQINQLVSQQIAQQSPVDRIEGGIVGGRWEIIP